MNTLLTLLALFGPRTPEERRVGDRGALQVGLVTIILIVVLVVFAIIGLIALVRHG